MNEIVNKAAKGNLKAFESIYREYFRFVANVAFRIVNHTDDAEEVAQEAFMAIYRNLSTFRGESALKTWIYRITLNTALNYAKKTAREYRHTVEYNDNMVDAQTSPEAENMPGGDEKEKAIAFFLNALNPDQRACIVLRSLEDLSYQEIAEILNIPINTVRSRIKRAREAMMALSKEVAQYEM